VSTIKQKRVFQKVVENGSPVSTAMVEVGYSKNTAVDPGKVTRSKGWQQLMDAHLPDRLLAKKHREGLEATTKKPHLIDRDDKGRPVYEYIPEEDYSTRHKYLDSAYKLKKRYPKEETGVPNNNLVVIVMPSEIMKKHGIRSYEEDGQKLPKTISDKQNEDV